MRLSQFHLRTTRETPSDAELASHRLMYRSGMIHKLASGLYTWSPLGLRVLRRVEAIVREEMDRAGALELLMPIVQPLALWEETARIEDFGPQLLQMTDRKEQPYCMGPTHEEVVTDFARQQLASYKQLPVNFYQIQTKFRDEIRPRFGVMRAREFLMKDAYSFHLSADCLDAEYHNMHRAYVRIFDRLGLSYRAVDADSGAIGGSASQEFQVLAESGEDEIAYSNASDYAANVELAPALPPKDATRKAPTSELTTVDTPKTQSIDAVAKQLSTPAHTILKTIIVQGADGLVALCVRGDHNINDVKAAKLPELGGTFVLAEAKDIVAATGCPPGFIGPVSLPESIPVIVDDTAALMSDFACGANQKDKHHLGVNFVRDARITRTADIRQAVAGDPAPDGKGTLSIARGIEVGHIFQLGQKYAESMNAQVLNDQGKKETLHMGCYGIGVSRIVAAAIEQNHDDAGIIWPEAMAPWQIAICIINPKNDPRVDETVQALEQTLTAKGWQVVIDDRGLRPGVMFSDIELIGIPHRIVVSPRGLDAGTFEYQRRDQDDKQALNKEELLTIFS